VTARGIPQLQEETATCLAKVVDQDHEVDPHNATDRDLAVHLVVILGEAAVRGHLLDGMTLGQTHTLHATPAFSLLTERLEITSLLTIDTMIALEQDRLHQD